MQQIEKPSNKSIHRDYADYVLALKFKPIRQINCSSQLQFNCFVLGFLRVVTFPEQNVRADALNCLV